MVSSFFDIRCIPAPSKVPSSSFKLSLFSSEAGGLHTCPGNEQDPHLLTQMGELASVFRLEVSCHFKLAWESLSKQEKNGSTENLSWVSFAALQIL